MTVSQGLSIVRDFVTSNPSSGNLQNADLTPTCDVYQHDNDTPILSLAVVLRTALTGHYRVTVDVTFANGFEVGGTYNVVVSATVDGISTKLVLDSFEVTAPVKTGAVVSNVGNSASTFETNRTETTTDYWKDTLCVFLTGTLAGQVKKVSAYDGSTKFFTVSGGFTGTPSALDTFIIVNL